jgi:hypothetical protein
MNDTYLITSVLGFNLKRDITTLEGELIKTGIKSTCYSCEEPVIKHKMIDKKFFTNFNESLLAKVLDYRRIND